MTTDLLPSFGKYTDVQRIGEGGFGEVYRAVDSTLNRPVALKVPHRELLRDPNFVAQFRAEAQIAAQLDHPNIVRIYSVGEFEDTPFIEMELVEGQTLADLIKPRAAWHPKRRSLSSSRSARRWKKRTTRALSIGTSSRGTS